MAEERLELIPRNRDKAVCVLLPLVLLQTETDLVPEDGHGKKNSGRPRSSSGSKVVLTLLTEVVVVHVGLSVIYIRGTGLQLLPGHLGDGGSWGGSGSGSLSLQNSLKNPLQVIFKILGNISSRDDSNGRFRP